MIKPYRYLIYKLYSFSKKGNLDTPIANVIITLSLTHILLLATLVFFILKISHWHLPKINYIYFYILVPLFILFNYFIFYNKKKWELYKMEFKDETKKNSVKGTILVLSYLIGIFVLFFSLLLLA